MTYFDNTYKWWNELQPFDQMIRLSDMNFADSIFAAISAKFVYQAINSGNEQVPVFSELNEHCIGLIREDIHKLLKSISAKLLYIEKTQNSHVYIWDDGVAILSSKHFDLSKEYENPEEDFYLYAKIVCTDLFNSQLKVLLNKYKAKPHEALPPAGSAYVLCQTQSGLEVVLIGLAGEALKRENYSSDAITLFDEAVKNLSSNKPNGRLIILDGPPGTGKTYMIKAFMDAAPNSKFVIVPPHMVKNLTDPNLIPTFINNIYSNGYPIVLVLEDADQCLSKRKNLNIESLSAVLNLTDGILGSLLDLRILATTNAPIEDFDDALLRKGRISSRISIGSLNFQEREKAWMALAGFKNKIPAYLLEQENCVLADIYFAYNSLTERERAYYDVNQNP